MFMLKIGTRVEIINCGTSQSLSGFIVGHSLTATEINAAICGPYDLETLYAISLDRDLEFFSPQGLHIRTILAHPDNVREVKPHGKL